MDIKGFTYGWDSKRGACLKEEAFKSQDLLFDTGINWMCFAFSIHQEKFSSTEIYFDYRNSLTDKEIIHTINRAHQRGIKVCLKPVINLRDGVWRALINFPDEDMWGEDKYWDTWFEYYTAFLCHYAEIAADTGCEMFCVGCEMSGTERKEKHWRNTIQEVKKIYTGPLVYNANHGREMEVSWFDAIDYIGTSAYYKVGKKPGDSKENMVTEWEKVAKRLKEVSEYFKKPVIFMEIGVRSAKGCAMMPWDFNHTEFERSEDEQGNFYDSCLEVFSGEAWFKGIFWWDWSTCIYDTKEEAKQDTGFNIHLKKAEEIMKNWYLKL